MSRSLKNTEVRLEERIYRDECENNENKKLFELSE